MFINLKNIYIILVQKIEVNDISLCRTVYFASECIFTENIRGKSLPLVY